MNATDASRLVTSSTGNIDRDGQIVGRSLREKQGPDLLQALVGRVRCSIFHLAIREVAEAER